MIVVGAGAFGGWCALELLRRGARVTVVEMAEPGHVLSSSGDESRVMRFVYGPDQIYADFAVRSLVRWRELEAAQTVRLFRQTGVLWMCTGDDHYLTASLPGVFAVGAMLRQMSSGEAAQQYPTLNVSDLTSIYHEPYAGVLSARLACRVVMDAAQRLGAMVVQGRAVPNVSEIGRNVVAVDGRPLEADVVVYACGPWLGAVLPEEFKGLMTPTRQETFWFEDLDVSGPVLLEMGERIMYSVPSGQRLKAGDDTRGSVASPGEDQGEPSREGALAADAFIRRRMRLVDVPRTSSGKVCLYENSPDGHLIVDEVPSGSGRWYVGGGSGHGFKLAPAVGELVARSVLGMTSPPDLFRFRFAERLKGRVTQFQHRSTTLG